MIRSSKFNDTLAGGKDADAYYVNNVGDKVIEYAGEGFDTVYATVNVAKVWDNVERVMYADTWAVVNWNATGNDQNNIIVGSGGANILVGGGGDDYLEAYDGNDTLTGGSGKDTFSYHGAGHMGTKTGHDVITDFDVFNDILNLEMAGDGDGDGTYGEYEDAIAAFVDKGAGKDVIVQLVNGGSITFTGIGTGTATSFTDLLADPSTQLNIT